MKVSNQNHEISWGLVRSIFKGDLPKLHELNYYQYNCTTVSYAATPWKIFHIYLESCDGQHDRESQQRHNFSQKLFFSVSYISTQGTKKNTVKIMYDHHERGKKPIRTHDHNRNKTVVD